MLRGARHGDRLRGGRDGRHGGAGGPRSEIPGVPALEQDKALPAGETFDASFDELARDRFIIGDPARVVDEIARYRERLGVTTMIFRLQWPGMDQEKVLRSIRLLGHKVLLKFLSG